MQIIPVIDVRDGIVVHATGGNRALYPPLNSVLTRSSQIEVVLTDILAFYPFACCYIADLDAIATGQCRYERYQQLAELFPQLTICLDIGVRAVQDIIPYLLIHNIQLVIGSETLTDLSVLENEQFSNRLILSLDQRQQVFLGDNALLSRTELWTNNCIAMSLHQVGSEKGPDWNWLHQLKELREDIKWFAAGGLRNKADIETLKNMGVEGALLATALHNGQITQQDLIDINCP